MVLLILLVAVGPLAAAPLPQENVVIITYPQSGDTVSGVVQILGSVAHPNFDRYSIYYAPGPAATATSQWQPLVLDVRQQVINGVLAEWDTTAIAEDGSPLIPNGVYHMVLIRYRDGDVADSFFLNNITVLNELATPTPTPELVEIPTPIEVETPTPVPVEMPPTATPRPSPTPRPTPTPSAPVPRSREFTLDGTQIASAFLRGARTTLLLFGAWGLYLVVKALFRYYLRTRRAGFSPRKTRR
ncbi:MAG: hypothetical protein RML46_07870 [Anaerolineae bacterium]|nr:hypothetical protein [Anaerolineae bacterium]MDW8068814.1 hypothetical protein [Anaerolineae bacterium]